MQIDSMKLPQLPEIPPNLMAEFKDLQRRIENGELGGMHLVAEIYRFQDKFNRFIGTYALCKAGCCKCCNSGVQVTHLEAEYIRAKTGVPAHKRNLTKGDGPCLFLKEGKCSIYPYRPYTCRTLHQLSDVRYCDPNYTSAEVPYYGSPVFGGKSFWDFLAMALLMASGGVINDIKAWFLSDEEYAAQTRPMTKEEGEALLKAAGLRS